MALEEFSDKERLRFRKLLEVAYSTAFAGERDAALGAATRMAVAHGMTLREAAGISEEKPPRPSPRANAHYRADFGAAAPDAMGTWWTRRPPPQSTAYHRTEAERVAAEKSRLAEAMEDAIKRGLDADERKARETAARRQATHAARPNKRGGSWRSRPEFVRVLLSETCMTAKEIASVAGVTVYDVFREKLLMRRSPAAT